jgi:hypothetical protein
MNMTGHESKTDRRIRLLRDVLIGARDAWPQLDNPSQISIGDQHISAADMLQWFTEWRGRAIDVLDETNR